MSQFYIGGDYANYDRRQGQRLFVSGDYVYFTADYLGLQIINVSDPSHPMLTASYPTPTDACDVFVKDSLAYLVCVNHQIPPPMILSSFHILNIADPSNPIVLDTLSITSDARAVWVQGNYAYVADDLSGLQVIDVSNPADPFIVGHYQAGDYAIDVTVAGNYAFIAYGYHGMEVVDVTDPAHPVYVANWNSPDIFFFVGVTISGNYAFLTSNGRFYIVDISYPTHPASLAYLQGDWYFGSDVSGNYAFVSALVTGLRVIDISNPANPIPAGAYEVPDQINDVAVSGDYAYVAGLDPNLSIVNISDPSDPHIVGSCSHIDPIITARPQPCGLFCQPETVRINQWG